MIFHTKSIEKILSPVAQQVSKLILLFEDATVGTEIPYLEQRVTAVKHAVDNLIKVGHDTIASSADPILRRDMPPCLKRVEDASSYLQESVSILDRRNGSALAKTKLIEGSRGILQGTSSVLLTFDMSEVRKIIQHCRVVLKVISEIDHIHSLIQLADFVKRLTPCMAHMIEEVDARQEDLTIQSHAALLRRSIEQIKCLTPIFISALKMHINTFQHNIPGVAECKANRDFLLSQMSEEIQEIIRGLQLTGTDSSELFDDDVAALHVLKSMLDSRLEYANDWFENHEAYADVNAEKSVMQLIQAARRLSELTGSSAEREAISGLCEDLRRSYALLHGYKARGEANRAEAHQLSSNCRGILTNISTMCSNLLKNQDRHNPVFRLPRTLEGKLAMVQRWLINPRGPHRQQGLDACHAFVSSVRGLLDSGVQYAAATAFPNNSHSNGDNFKLEKDAALEACDHVDRVAKQLYAISMEQETTQSSASSHELALAMSRSLSHIWNTLQQHVVNRIAETYTDIIGPLRRLAEAAAPPSGCMPNESAYNERALTFLDQCNIFSATAELTAGTSLSNVWRADALRALVNRLPEVGDQVVKAGHAVMAYGADPDTAHSPMRQAALDHFKMMQQYWTDSAEQMRQLVDETVDANTFIAAQEHRIRGDVEQTEESIKQRFTTGVVDSTTSIARRANRILQMATREANNSEDPPYVDRMNDAVSQLRSTIPPMVNEAKYLVTDIANPTVHAHWRSSNQQLINAVGVVRDAVGPAQMTIPYYHQQYEREKAPTSTNDTLTNGIGGLSLEGGPHSPELARYIKHQSQHRIRLLLHPNYHHHQNNTLPPYATFQYTTQSSQGGTEPSDTDVEEEFNFPPPEENQPIMAAAHALHHEARFWSSRDNELIATAKRMAALMAQFSLIVRGECGTKSDLINVAMMIVKMSIEASVCTETLAKECTDLRFRSTLQQLSDRILTIGNQLKILSTVKATMLGAQGSDEDHVNTESLVGNAQNLMQTVIDALRAAAGASIKLRVDSGYKIVWRPRAVFPPQQLPASSSS